VKSGAPEGQAFPAPPAAPVMMSHMLYQGIKITHNFIMTYRWHQPRWSLRHDKAVSNDDNDQRKILSVDLSLVSMKP